MHRTRRWIIASCAKIARGICSTLQTACYEHSTRLTVCNPHWLGNHNSVGYTGKAVSGSATTGAVCNERWTGLASITGNNNYIVRNTAGAETSSTCSTVWHNSFTRKTNYRTGLRGVKHVVRITGCATIAKIVTNWAIAYFLWAEIANSIVGGKKVGVSMASFADG